jgi:alpha-tubulin suppressor-like RCC1 family protein
MTVSYLRVRWLTVLTILGIAGVLSACSDSSAPTPEPTATTPVPTDTPASAPTGTVGSTPTSAQSPINAFASVSAGFFHTCGVRADGSVECWGSDSDGQSSAPSETTGRRRSPAPSTRWKRR